MTRPNQLAKPLSAQPDLFISDRPDDNWQPRKYGGDPDRVRAHLHKILDIARTAKRLSSNDLRLYRTIFPQMASWLPDDEAAQLRFDFEVEIKRLEAA